MMVNISVIVPIYNKVQYLQRTIDSILAQTMQNLEILLIDDCSTDGSYELCQSLYGQHKRVHLWQNAENMGASVTRNAGIEAACGRFIAFVDADDVLYPDYLKRMYQMALRENADIVAEGSREITGPLGLDIPLAQRAEYVWQGKYMTACCQKLFSRELILRSNIRFHPIVFFEDVLFSIEALLAAKRFALLPDTLYEIIETPESITRGDLLAKAPQYVDSVAKAIRFLSDYMESIPDLAADKGSKQILFVFIMQLSLLSHFYDLTKQHSLEAINEQIRPIMEKEFGVNYQYVTLLLDWCMNKNRKEQE